ncbi:ATP-binding protein [Mycobacterium sp. 21AC1]|uniref:hypothetical protein n=1 Tax=[Mycobacterium] appelbergii TaxID=2939269 RepID=UPI0029394197|nr:hypothetical protein [Mycobacterium sp. 21AC1]MDV3126923.1 ATP-binding protein [Mycobacterium sp. 21AC1]
MAARPEQLAVARTLVAALADSEKFDVEDIADVRLAVDAACTVLVQSAAADSMLRLVVDPGDDAITVDASTTCDTPEAFEPDDLNWNVLTSLTDEVSTFSRAQDQQVLIGISMTTRPAGPWGSVSPIR